MQQEPIGEKLVRAGLIDRAQLAHALSVQSQTGKGKIVNILISLGYVTPHACMEFLAKQPSVASVDLSHYEISPDVVSLIPREMALEQEIVPIDKVGNTLTLGMACPLDKATVRKIEELTRLIVKPVLCAADDVRSAIERYYPQGKKTTEPAEDVEGLSSPVRLAQVASVVRKLESLPALPETVMRVREAMHDPNSSVSDVTKIVVLDPPIAAKVLSVANSAAYGFPQRVDDINLGITLLGLRETYEIVLSCTVLDMYKRATNFDYRAFWGEAMACATASRIIAKHAGQRNAFGVFSAGLLHDIGRIALSEVTPRLYAKIDPYLPPDKLIAEESRVIGITHTEAGYMLAVNWQLPPEITEPIRWHHKPSMASVAQTNVAVVALASAVIRAAGTTVEENEGLLADQQELLDFLSLDERAADAILAEFLQKRDDSIRVALD